MSYIDNLIAKFSDAVNLEVITCTIAPPKKGIAILTIRNNVTQQSVFYDIYTHEHIAWYEIAKELDEGGWL